MTVAQEWSRGTARNLIEHIMARFHKPLRADLAALSDMFAAAPPHPTLEALDLTFAALRDELLGHMMKEEHVLFPYILELEAAVEGTVASPRIQHRMAGGIVAVMMREHADAGLSLVSLRRISGGFEPNADADDATRAIYAALAAMDDDLRKHIALEDNVLFPQAMELERKALA